MLCGENNVDQIFMLVLGNTEHEAPGVNECSQLYLEVGADAVLVFVHG